MFKAYNESGWLDPNLLIYVPACLALAWAWWRLTRETADPLLLGVPFYVLLHVVYPYEAGRGSSYPCCRSSWPAWLS